MFFDFYILEKEEEKEIKKGTTTGRYYENQISAPPYITRISLLGWLFHFLHNLCFGYFGK
jgi:hypothetical protein